MTRLLKDPIGQLRLAGFVEGTTLILLLFVAVPLKRLGEYPTAVTIMGPIHGFTFIAYLIMATNAVSGGGWRAGEIARVLIAAVLPFGTFINDRYLARKHTEFLQSQES